MANILRASPSQDHPWQAPLFNVRERDSNHFPQPQTAPTSTTLPGQVPLQAQPGVSIYPGDPNVQRPTPGSPYFGSTQSASFLRTTVSSSEWSTLQYGGGQPKWNPQRPDDPTEDEDPGLVHSLQIPERPALGCREPGEEQALSCCLWLLTLLAFPILLLGATVKLAMEYERVVILRLGRLLSGGDRGPGIICFVPCTDEVFVADIRTQTVNMKSQRALTADSVQISINGVLNFRITDATAAIGTLEDVEEATGRVAMALLRDAIGRYSLEELLKQKAQISAGLMDQFQKAVNRWGILVELLEIKDILLPNRMIRDMAVQAEAQKGAAAKVTLAEGEERAAHMLREAGDMLNKDESAVQLRTLQQLAEMAMNKRSKTIVPIPLSGIFDSFPLSPEERVGGGSWF